MFNELVSAMKKKKIGGRHRPIDDEPEEDEEFEEAEDDEEDEEDMEEEDDGRSVSEVLTDIAGVEYKILKRILGSLNKDETFKEHGVKYSTDFQTKILLLMKKHGPTFAVLLNHLGVDFTSRYILRKMDKSAKPLANNLRKLFDELDEAKEGDVDDDED